MVWRALRWTFVTASVWLGGQNAAQAARVVYLNLDPQAINNANGNDPTSDSFSTSSFVPGTVTGLTGLSGDERAELLYWFKEATYPLNIQFTDERPATGPYDMLVFGDASNVTAMFPDVDCPFAISIADCGDNAAENINFMFWGCLPESQQRDFRRIAFYGLTSLGFGWGLDNVSVSGEVMGSYSQAALRFGTQCVPVSGTSTCAHLDCAANQQNSTAELTALVQLRQDDGPPTVEILSPADDTVVSPNLTVEARVDDRFGGLTVTLEVVEAAQSFADPIPPYRWELADIPAGDWTLRVHATDADGNETQSEVSVCVGPCGEGPGSSTGDGGSATSSTGDATHGGSDDRGTDGIGSSTGDTPAGSTSMGDGGIDPTFTPVGELDSGGTTGCATAWPGRGRGPSWWWVGLLVLGPRRRRDLGRASKRPLPCAGGGIPATERARER